MPNTIHIKAARSGELAFEIRDSLGALIALSGGYRTICRLESALSTLQSITPGAYVAESGESQTKLGVTGSRKRVTFEGILPGPTVGTLLDRIAQARVVDERPVGRRRTDLTGRLCDLEHD
jgi:hypothetical protein